MSMLFHIPELSQEQLTTKPTSGDVLLERIDVHELSHEMTVSREAEFSISAETTYGDIACDFPITVKGKYKKNRLSGYVGSEENTINLKTTSEDMRPGK